MKNTSTSFALLARAALCLACILSFSALTFSAYGSKTKNDPNKRNNPVSLGSDEQIRAAWSDNYNPNPGAAAIAGAAGHAVTPSVPAAPVCTTPMSSNCFVADTLVRTTDGARRIQDIRAGDSVLSFNERKGRVEPARVSKVIVGRRADLTVVTSRHGAITCTQDHPFYTARGLWTKAAALSSSDWLMTLGPDSLGVIPAKCAAKSKEAGSPVRVYNIEVEKNHDYFVGPDAILSHNASLGKRRSR